MSVEEDEHRLEDALSSVTAQIAEAERILFRGAIKGGMTLQQKGHVRQLLETASEKLQFIPLPREQRTPK